MDDSIINKIQKLIAKAESAQDIGNIDEAAAFSAKVNELLIKYNLEKADIKSNEDPDINHKLFKDLDITSRQGGWTINLLTTICEYNLCEAIYHREYKMNAARKRKIIITGVSIIGTPENIEIVKYLYSMLSGQFRRLASPVFSDYMVRIRKQLQDNGHKGTSKEVKKPWLHYKNVSNRSKILKSFYHGAVIGVAIRLQRSKAEATAEYGDKLTDMVHVSNAAVTQYKDENFGELDNLSDRKKKLDEAAVQKGIIAGTNADLVKGVANGDTISTKFLN